MTPNTNVNAARMTPIAKKNSLITHKLKENTVAASNAMNMKYPFLAQKYFFLEVRITAFFLSTGSFFRQSEQYIPYFPPITAQLKHT